MKNRVYRNCVRIVFALVAFTGCNDAAFLEEKPRTDYSPDNIFSSSEQIDQVLIACYQHIRGMYCMAAQDATGFVFKGGNGTDMFDVPSIRSGNAFNNYGTLNSTNGVFDTNFSHWYQLIAKANLALHGAELPQITWGSEKGYVIAQARFFRAWAYRNLGELYGGVPITTEMSAAPSYDWARASRVETYQFAIDELEAVVNDFPETTPVAGRLVRGAAQHTLCQLYLDLGLALEQEGKSAEAATAYGKSVTWGNLVIDGSIYSLMTERFGTRRNDNPDYHYAELAAQQTPDRLYSAAGYPIEGNVYWDLFQEGNQDYQQGNRESIWTAQVDWDAYLAEDKQSCLPYGLLGPIFRDVAPTHVKGLLEDVGGRGVSFATPTMYTRDIIYEGKWGDDMRNSEAAFRRVILGNQAGSPYFGKPIPWSVFYSDAEGARANVSRAYPISCKIHTDKYTGLADGQNRTNLFRDEYLIRLPETILLRAEAKMRGGDNTGAAADVNLLRARANCGYMVTAADMTVDLILDERARELVYEETRWNTLLRMGGTVARDRIRQYALWDHPRTFIPDFNLWPIPQNMLDTNTEVPMTQNPGWN